MTKLLLILTLPAFLIFTSHDSPGQDPPNIILLYADDLGYTDLSCQGSDYYRTPNIDRLASEGVTFTNAYAAAANCAPARASLAVQAQEACSCDVQETLPAGASVERRIGALGQ